jgi:hypothetical protein
MEEEVIRHLIDDSVWSGRNLVVIGLFLPSDAAAFHQSALSLVPSGLIVLFSFLTD